MLLCPLQDSSYSLSELEIASLHQRLRVSWNVNSVNLFQELLGFFIVKLPVNRNNTGSRRLQELDVSVFDELASGEDISDHEGRIVVEHFLVLLLFQLVELGFPHDRVAMHF